MGTDLARLSYSEFDAELTRRLERPGAAVQSAWAVMAPQADAIRAPRQAQQRWAEAEAAHAALNEARDELAPRTDIRLGRA